MEPILLMLLAAAPNATALDAAVAPLLAELQQLNAKDIDVAPLAAALDRAVKLAAEGRTAEAQALLAQLRANITALGAEADRIYLQNAAYRYGLAALLLASPVAVYLLLPRLYLALWYRLHRRWLVRHAGKR